MKFFRLEIVIWVFLLAALPVRGPAGQPTPPVQNLQCDCITGREGKPEATLRWFNPANLTGFLIAIRRDGAEIDLVPGLEGGVEQSYTDANALPDFHLYEVIVISRDGIPSQPVPCQVNCPPGGQPRPEAVILGPERLVLPPAGVAEAFYDGRGSRDSRGGRAIGYIWQTPEPAVVDIHSPNAFLTRVEFKAPGRYVLRLVVFDALDQQRFADAFLQVDVVKGAVDEAAVFLPPLPDLLVAIAGRRFELPLTLVGGSPFPDLQVVNGPRGLIVDPALARLRWLPPMDAAGRQFAFEVLATNTVGTRVLPLAIKVLDPAQPVILYGFPLSTGGRDDGGIPGAAAGGGGSLGPAPLFLGDQAPIEPSLALELSPFLPGEDCAVQLVTAGGADPFDGLRFDPECAGAGSSGGYFSGSAAAKILENVTNDFTIELWLSRVSAVAPPGGRSFVFSMSSGTASIDWLIGHDGGATFTAVVRVNGVGEELSVTASPRADGLTNLVFVRSGDEHRFYVNGARAVSRNVPHADPVDASWDPSYALFLGNSSDETRPFDGDFHLAAMYGEALSDALIRFLDTMGPSIPSFDGVPAPIADICPDPREIRRGVDADGSLSHSLIGGGGGGGGGLSNTCPDMLRPFEWTLTPSLAGTNPTASPTGGEEECWRVIRVHYDDPPPGVRFDLEILLKVTQVPVRGVTKSDTMKKTIRLPTYFKRGDVNLDDALDISDGIAILLGVYVAERELRCADSGDVNDDGALNTADAVSIFHSLFLGGPAPRAPYPACGADPSPDPPSSDDLGCGEPPPYCS